MSARSNYTRGVQEVSVKWTYVRYGELSERQRRAWDWLWRELLKPLGESHRPQPESRGGMTNVETREVRNVKGPGASIPGPSQNETGCAEQAAANRLDIPPNTEGNHGEF